MKILSVFGLLLAAASFGGCAAFDRAMPPWGPPEQWEPALSENGSTSEPVNYAAIFDEAA